jgi:hypothetical protein
MYVYIPIYTYKIHIGKIRSEMAKTGQKQVVFQKTIYTCMYTHIGKVMSEMAKTGQKLVFSQNN